MMDYKYIVSTRCFTYNHAPFIRETLHGFSLQETTFPIVFIIVDDASVDGEPNILRKWAKENLQLNEALAVHKEMPYGELIYARHNQQPNSFFSILLLAENHYQTGRSAQKMSYISEWFDNSKYIALCEGDDYWIHPHKLQMQVDFMDKHPDYSLCHTDFTSTIKRITHYKERFKNDVYFPRMLNEEWTIGTLTVLYRKNTYEATPRYYIGKGWSMGDKPLWYELASLGKVKYFPKITAVYRVLQTSASHFTDIKKQISFVEAGLDIKQFYALKYGIELKDNGYDKPYYTKILKITFKFGDRDLAEKYFKEAYDKNMLSIKGIIFYIGVRYNFFRKIMSLFTPISNK